MENLFGSNLLLFSGDIVTGPNGNVGTTTDYENNNPTTARFPGYYNMVFSLFDKISTIIGDNIFHPDYGTRVGLILSQPNSPNTAAALKEEITNALKSDGRVKSIESIEITQEDNKIHVSAFVTLENSSQSYQFLFPAFIVE